MLTHGDDRNEGRDREHGNGKRNYPAIVTGKASPQPGSPVGTQVSSLAAFPSERSYRGGQKSIGLILGRVANTSNFGDASVF